LGITRLAARAIPGYCFPRSGHRSQPLALAACQLETSNYRSTSACRRIFSATSTPSCDDYFGFYARTVLSAVPHHAAARSFLVPNVSGDVVGENGHADLHRRSCDADGPYEQTYPGFL